MSNFTPRDVAVFITSWYFINIGIPLITVVVGIFVKVVSRSDRHLKLKRDDFVVGFDIALGAFLLFVNKMVSANKALLTISDPKMREDLQNKLTLTPWMIIVWMMGFWAISTIIRKWGWVSPITSGDSRSTSNDHPTYIGIIIPFIFGIASLIFAINWTGGDR